MEAGLHRYCILCSACLCEPLAETLLSYQEPSGEGPFIHEDQVYWLGKSRMIGETRLENHDMQATFLTGSVRQRGRACYFTRGTAQGVQFGGRIVRGKDSKELLRVEGAVDMVRGVRFQRIHERCCLVLWHFLTYKKLISCSLEELDEVITVYPVLYTSMLGYSRASEKRHCGRRHEEDDTRQRARSRPEAGHLSQINVPKEHVCDPGSEDWLPSLISTTPKIIRHEQPYSRKASRAEKQVPMDGLAMLPPEVLCLVASYLEARQLRILCLASEAVSRALNRRMFWLRRIREDLPWIWEMRSQDDSTSTVSSIPMTTDWLDLYFKLLDSSIYHPATQDLGLINRRRIWKICEKLSISWWPQQTTAATM